MCSMSFCIIFAHKGNFKLTTQTDKQQVQYSFFRIIQPHKYQNQTFKLPYKYLSQTSSTSTTHKIRPYRTETPAGAALSLILHFRNGSFPSPIYRLWQLNISRVNEGHGFNEQRFVFHLQQGPVVTVHGVFEFVMEHVGVFVDAQFVRDETLSIQFVVFGNFVRIFHEDFHAEFFFSFARVLFVVGKLKWEEKVGFKGKTKFFTDLESFPFFFNKVDEAYCAAESQKCSKEYYYLHFELKLLLLIHFRNNVFNL